MIANVIRLTDAKTKSITDFINLSIINGAKYTKVLLQVLIRILIPLILIILSGFYLIGNIVAYTNQINFLCFSPNLVLTSLIIFIVNFIILIYFLLKYTIVTFIYYSKPNTKPKEIVNKSNELMKGNKIKYLLLLLSFFNWFIIAGIILFILNKFIELEYLTSFIILFYSILKPYIIISKLNFFESLGE